MAKRKNNAEAAEASAATVGYEAKLWQMANALRGSMDAAAGRRDRARATRIPDF